ncbi:TRAFAC clade GTPase domain-containing protein [Paraburkholderia sp. RL17-347-BIC-D]|uniref:TRAFAC clade GTPase domain-containing protein n=1 Tax=Paraburkholderia sp. RL17-347-BIC-D TaxID=3031632 RepID=UPI0038BA8DD4
MTRRSIVLLGGPDSGKTNYIGRLWPSFKKRKGVLRAERLPDDIAYVDGAVEHLMQGSFAPRSDRNLEVGRADFSISVRGANGQGNLTELMVPDISGELWTRTVATFEISQEWLDVLNEAEGAVVFVRARSDQIVQPLDWVTARNILRLDAEDDESVAGPEAAVGDEQMAAVEAEQSLSGDDASNVVEVPSEPDLPTQVVLCELLRYLYLYLADRVDGGRPHVAVVVAAWDLLDPEVRAAGPMAYLKREFPLFAGRLADTGRLDVRLFGLSVVGGDLEDDEEFRNRFLERDISEQGWVVVNDGDGLRTDEDVMLPIAWAMGE